MPRLHKRGDRAHTDHGGRANAKEDVALARPRGADVTVPSAAGGHPARNCHWSFRLSGLVFLHMEMVIGVRVSTVP